MRDPVLQMLINREVERTLTLGRMVWARRVAAYEESLFTWRLATCMALGAFTSTMLFW